MEIRREIRLYLLNAKVMKGKIKSKLKLISVVGARPNFMKIAPLIKEINKAKNIESILVHTGQHYDDKLSKLFFEDLAITKPNIYLNVGSGTHAFQTAEIMRRFEQVLLKNPPHVVIVVGDVNSTIACAMTAVKMGIKVAHIEAGLRSFDRSMPEEINRILTDAISDYLFTTCEDANKNLRSEGIPKKKIFFVGNVMIDTLLSHHKNAMSSLILKNLDLTKKPYILMTLHRPSNVDDKRTLFEIIRAVQKLSLKAPVVFPVHPRTKKQIEIFRLNNKFHNITQKSQKISSNGIFLIEPLGYLDFLHLLSNARLVLTDSGGIQEETTILQVPCLTIRENTERPITVKEGTNILVGTNSQKIIDKGIRLINGNTRKGRVPKLWDGKASKRIISKLLKEVPRERIEESS